jgi:6,7-dimethyl-8-ribityllumazine synthase
MENFNSGKIAFIQAGWHGDIVDRCREGFAARLSELGFAESQIDYFKMPGAFELPLKCKQLLDSGDYAMTVAAGFVVDGGIYRHEFVAQSVVSALMQVQLELGLPILSAVLTPKEFDEENSAHQKYFFDHMLIKGREVADAAHALLSEENGVLARSA